MQRIVPYQVPRTGRVLLGVESSGWAEPDVYDRLDGLDSPHWGCTMFMSFSTMECDVESHPSAKDKGCHCGRVLKDSGEETGWSFLSVSENFFLSFLTLRSAI